MALVVIGLVLYTAVSLKLGRADERYALALAAPVAMALLGAAACYRARARTSVAQWGLMGLGAGTYAVACAIGALVHSGPVSPPPMLAFVGTAFALAYLVFIITLLRFAGVLRGNAPALRSADAALIFGSCFAVAWSVLLGPIATVKSLPHHIFIFALIYLVEDTLLVLAAVVLIQKSGGRCRPLVTAGRVAAAMIFLVVGDVLDVCAIRMGWGAGFTFAGGLWIIGLYELYIAATRAEKTDGGAPQPHTTRAEPTYSFAATTITIGAAVLILLCEVSARGSVGTASLGVAGALMAAYLFRQWAAMSQTNRLLRENVAYSDRLKGFNAELEETVVRRTRYLKALHAITANTKATLDEHQVLSLCLAGTVDALLADGGCVFLDESSTPAVVAGDEASLDAISRRVDQWRANQDTTAQRHVDGLFSLLGVAGRGSNPLALMAVWRHDRGFTAEENQLMDSIGLELEAALNNARLHELAAAAADRDPLTGLLNHRAMQQRLAFEISRCRREDRPLAAIMLDLNDFKIFNDTFGHPVGDDVLRHVAETLTSCTRGFDLVARYGGDEFALGLPGADHETAREIGERIRISLYENGFNSAAGELPLRISYGIAVCPDDAINRKDLLALADADLYRAKQTIGASRAGSENLRAGLDSIPSFTVLDSLVSALDQRDRYSRRHSEEVTLCALSIAEDLNWPAKDLRSLRIAGLLHDVGKVGVPEHLLRKPGRFSEEEHEAMRHHSAIGHMLARSLHAGEMVENAIRHHHERWDGQGYPCSLAGEGIPEIARLLAVADAYSAMTTHRPYRRALDPPDALQLLRNGAGTQWDPEMVAAFERSQATAVSQAKA